MQVLEPLYLEFGNPKKDCYAYLRACYNADLLHIHSLLG